MRRLAVACFPLVLALSGALVGCSGPDRDSGNYAIVGATLIDGTALVPVDNSVVLIDDGKITAMGRAPDIPIPQEAKRVNGQHRFVFPLILDQPLVVDGPADLILCEVNPARDPDYMKKTVGRMELGRWKKFPN